VPTREIRWGDAARGSVEGSWGTVSVLRPRMMLFWVAGLKLVSDVVRWAGVRVSFD